VTLMIGSSVPWTSFNFATFARSSYRRILYIHRIRIRIVSNRHRLCISWRTGSTSLSHTCASGGFFGMVQNFLNSLRKWSIAGLAKTMG